MTSVLLLLSVIGVRAQEADSTAAKIALLEQSFKYETGTIDLSQGDAKLTVPEGFKFLNQEQSMYVLSDLWGNPPDSSVLGMLVPTNKGVLGDDSWALTIAWDGMGFVKDDDADDINYDDLLKEQQKETRDANQQRVQEGYQPIDFIGWALPPYYDKDKKVLHWAKELKFGEDSLNTLNYNLRVLGRKGVYVINAIATMKALPEVKQHLDKVVNSVTFNEGSRYDDFDSDVDQIAAWTVGGLVAGKVLAKVGFFAVLVKFWKLIAFGAIAAGGAIMRFLRGRKKEEEEIQEILQTPTTPETPETPETTNPEPPSSDTPTPPQA